ESDVVALRRAAVQAVKAINRLAVQPRSPAEVGRCLRTAALGEDAVAEAMLSAFAQAGRDGLIRVQPAPAGQSRERARVTWQRGPASSMRTRKGQPRSHRRGSVKLARPGWKQDSL